MAADRAPVLGDVQRFWERNPVASEGLSAEPGDAAYFAEFDRLREAEGCEPYDFSNEIHGYDRTGGPKVLDVGCGNGYVLSRYARHGARVDGVDLTDTVVSLSRKRFAAAGLTGSFTQIDGQLLPFADGTFDIVCSMGVLHHIPGPAPLVAEIGRVMRPGGTLIAMLYYRYSWNAMVLTRLRRLADPRFRGLSQQEALNRLDGPGCPLVQVYSHEEARALFHAFEEHTFELNLLTWRQLFLAGPLEPIARRVLGSPSRSLAARKLGWNLYIKARKPETRS